MKRRRHAPIRTAAQLEALTSPVTHDLLLAFRSGGPGSVADLGPRIGKRINSLHYHVRKLVAAGFLRQVGSRRSGARTEAIYDIVAERFAGPSAPAPPRLRALTADVVAALLRRAARDFGQAIGSPDSVEESGPRRNVVATRYSAWLTASDLARANRLIDELHELFENNAGKQQGNLHVLTTVLTPAAARKDQP